MTEKKVVREIKKVVKEIKIEKAAPKERKSGESVFIVEPEGTTVRTSPSLGNVETRAERASQTVETSSNERLSEIEYNRRPIYVGGPGSVAQTETRTYYPQGSSPSLNIMRQRPVFEQKQIKFQQGVTEREFEDVPDRRTYTAGGEKERQKRRYPWEG